MSRPLSLSWITDKLHFYSTSHISFWEESCLVIMVKQEASRLQHVCVCVLQVYVPAHTLDSYFHSHSSWSANAPLLHNLSCTWTRETMMTRRWAEGTTPSHCRIWWAEKICFTDIMNNKLVCSELIKLKRNISSKGSYIKKNSHRFENIAFGHEILYLNLWHLMLLTSNLHHIWFNSCSREEDYQIIMILNWT